MKGQKYVAYLRVSTDKQGRSGLGLEAQRAAVTDFVDGGRAKLLGEFVEVESGRRADRPQLALALSACRLHKATLVVAKLDRLSRDAHFLLGIKESGVDFVCCDMPSANRLTVGIMAMVAEEEARMISARTKAALQAAKARGVVLGTPNLTRKIRLMGAVASAQSRRRVAVRRADDLRAVVAEVTSSGSVSLRTLAREFNRRGIPATRGGLWTATQVRRVLRIAPSQVTQVGPATGVDT